MSRRHAALVQLSAREVRALVGLQRAVAGTPLPQGARALSAWGEHARGWLVLIGIGALIDASRRPVWASAGVTVLAAHTGAVVAKRVVRRQRPTGQGLEQWDHTASTLSFPSAHASSTTAAALALAPLLGGALTAPPAVAMAASRLILGVHYPTDVLAGAVWGASAARLVRRRLSPLRAARG